MEIVLKYIGKDSIIGVPARDLTQEDLAIIERDWTIETLINSGLYEFAEDKQPAKKGRSKKESEE